MRMRENRPTIEDSMATMLEIEGRTELVGHIRAKLGLSGAVVTDDMVHVSHYGFDERIDWDEYIVVVEKFGVFGFTDAPCPFVAPSAGLSGKGAAAPEAKTAQQLFGAETEGAYGLNR